MITAKSKWHLGWMCNLRQLISRWVMCVCRHNLEVQMILFVFAFINTHALSPRHSNNLTLRKIFHVSCRNTKAINTEPGGCNHRGVINYTLWHRLKQQPCWSTGNSVMMDIPLTCKKLEVCGFHFSSGLPCHVLRILKHTWLKKNTHTSIPSQQNDIHPKIATCKSNTAITIGNRPRKRTFRIKHLCVLYLQMWVISCQISFPTSIHSSMLAKWNIQYDQIAKKKCNQICLIF